MFLSHLILSFLEKYLTRGKYCYTFSSSSTGSYITQDVTCDTNSNYYKYNFPTVQGIVITTNIISQMCKV